MTRRDLRNAMDTDIGKFIIPTGRLRWAIVPDAECTTVKVLQQEMQEKRAFLGHTTPPKTQWVEVPLFTSGDLAEKD